MSGARPAGTAAGPASTAGGPAGSPAASTTIVGGRPLRGTIRPPGDKSISHRALLFAALAEGTSAVRGLSDGDDVARTRHAVESLGASVDWDEDRAGCRISGGRDRLRSATTIDVGNSGTGIRLLAGLASSLPCRTELTGDDSIRRRPMDRVTTPLSRMGARITGRSAPGGGLLAPLVVEGGDLIGIDYQPPVASAQVKSAVLIAALAAEGETTVREPVPTRRHTEEMLALCGAPVQISDLPGGGLVVRVRAASLRPFELEVPADPSQAAFFVVAGCTVPGSEVVCENVYVGPGRACFLDVLRRMGARVEVHSRSETTADIVASYGPLHGTEVGGAEVPGLIDEVPALAMAAAVAEGPTTFRDVAELRVKESDRMATISDAVAAMGGRVEALPAEGSLVVIGGRLSGGGRVDSHGDHRIAMAAAVAALALEEPVQISGWEAVATSYPGFVSDVRALQGS